MRHYYDFDGWEKGNAGVNPSKWERGETPAPFGAVPGAVSPGPVRPPARSSGTRKRRSAATKGSRRGIALFAIILLLLLTLTGVGFYLSGATISLPPVAETWEWFRGTMENSPPWENTEPDGEDGWEYYEPYQESEEDWLADLPKTTADRAPLAEGVTLLLAPAGEEALTPQEIYQKVNPAVVQVRSYLRNGYSLGTGVVMNADGYIITNAHVIAGARQIDVVLTDGRRCRSRLLGYAGSEDLAVIKIETGDLELTVAEFGDSTTLRVGDPAYAIGNPLGNELRGTFTDGIISAIDRSVSTDGGEQTLLQTTAALNSGNSGGALINEYGQVIGITNMKMMSSDETIEGLGFAIPTSVVRPVVAQLISTGTYLGKPMLGITVVTVEEGELAEGSPAGAMVYSVVQSSDAWKKGLREGDVITGANGKPVTCTEDLLAIKNELGVGDTLELKLWSAQRTRTVRVTLVGSNALLG